MTNPDPLSGTGEKINFDLMIESEKQKERIHELEIENSKLKTNLGAAKNHNEEIILLQNINKRLEEENKSLSQQLQAKSESLSSLNQLPDKYKELEILKMNLQKELDETKDELNKLKMSEIPNDEKFLIKEGTNDVSDRNQWKKELKDSKEIISEQNVVIEKLEKELLDLDNRYDTYIIGLKKQIKSLESDVKRLEKTNMKISSDTFSHLRPSTPPHSSPSSNSSDSALLDKMRELLKSWPGGIKLRNLAMSMGISVSVTNDLLKQLEDEKYVKIDREHAVNSNPVVYPV